MAYEGTAGRSGAGAVMGGTLAGLFAGMLMLISAVVYTAVGGSGVALAPKMIAGTFYGPMALVGGAGVIAIGVLTHFAVAITLGVIFAVITARLSSTPVSFILGILYGIAVWAFMTYVTLAVFNDTMLSRVLMASTWWFFLHWIFGGFLGLFAPGLRGRGVRRIDAEAPTAPGRLAA